MNKYRHELKMSINAFDRAVLSSRLSHLLNRDEHSDSKGYYIVRSIYFDDLADTALQEKLMGVKYREKFRLRTYDSFTSVIRLEKKDKNNNIGYKESVLLSKEECLSLLNGEYWFLRSRPEPVCKQFYSKLRTGLFKPKTIVQYNREAYVWDPGRIRITLDSNIQTGLKSVDFLNFALPLTSVGENELAILEIKYDDFLPAHIADLLKLDSRQMESVSKYVLGRCFG